MKKKELSDLKDAKLRAEPDYKDLCALLDQQTDSQKDRLSHALIQSQGCEPSQNEGADTMESRTRGLDARIVELKDTSGLSFSQVAERLNAEGYKNQAGGTFTRKSVAGRYYRFKGKDGSQPCESCEDAPECQNPPLSRQPAQPCEQSQYNLPPKMVETVRVLIREEIQAMSEEAANLAKAAKADVEMPPPTPKAPGTKRFLGERVTMPGMKVDSVLYTAFKKECKELNLSASDGLQRILWLHFGRPALSFHTSPTARGDQTASPKSE